jgi:K(+)-stimulated pyrophosphate-energized sodium pump
MTKSLALGRLLSRFLDSLRANAGLTLGLALAALASLSGVAQASEMDLQIPAINTTYTIFGAQVSGLSLMYGGFAICFLGALFGYVQFMAVKKLPVHKSMSDVSNIIYETCKTYLIQQGRLLIVLEVLIGGCIAIYFGAVQHLPISTVGLILLWSVFGILGSYSVAWFGVRINTYANSRTAFASSWASRRRCTRSRCSRACRSACSSSASSSRSWTILLFVPGPLANAVLLGFAIGESLGASALRIAGGIFTKIADIGSDLMKIAPRSRKTIHQSASSPTAQAITPALVGPTADGFETYGVTGVALISFIVLAVMPEYKADFLVWIFVMRVLMILTSIVSYQINHAIAHGQNAGKDKIDFEAPLTSLVWITSLLSIAVTFGIRTSPRAARGRPVVEAVDHHLVRYAAAAVIPELTRCSPARSRHAEVVNASRAADDPRASSPATSRATGRSDRRADADRLPDLAPGARAT